MNKFKNVIFRMINNSFGRVIRSLHKMLPEEQYSIFKELKLRSLRLSAQFVETSMPYAIYFDRKEAMWDYCLSNSKSNQATLLEFGVFQGYSINYFADARPSFTLFGFDSFLGLEEDWGGYVLTKSALSLQGKIPHVRNNVKLISGTFENTLPRFLENNDLKELSIIHIDSDTYSPAKFVLENLRLYLSSGVIIIFDEFFNYPGYLSHEFKAWNEFSNSWKINFRYIAYSNESVAIQIVGNVI